MRFSDLFILSTRMFKARTSRTFLTILGMSVGIGAILFLVSLGYGLQRTLLEKITTSDSLLTLDVSPDRSNDSVLDFEAVSKMEEIDGVVEISPSFQISSQGKIDDLITDISAMIVRPSYLRLSGIKAGTGEILDEEKKEGVIVSSSVAQIFGKTPEELVGREISFAFYVSRGEEMDIGGSSNSDKKSLQRFESDKKFKIIGVVETDESLAYLNLDYVGDLGMTRYSQIKVKSRNTKEMDFVRSEISSRGFFVSSLSETVDQANKVFAIVKIVLMLFGVIALVVSAIGMFNTMTITLLERTEEIGIMKSIGASDRTISLIFIMESTIMGFLGGVVGIFIGWAEGEIFNVVVNMAAKYFGGESVDLFYSPFWFVTTVIIFSAFVGFLTGVIPARRASRIDPLDALRYK